MKHRKIVYFVLCEYLFIYCPVLGQFPRLCTDTNSIRNRFCCPKGQGNSACGASSQRGYCTVVTSLLSWPMLQKMWYKVFKEQYSNEGKARHFSRSH